MVKTMNFMACKLYLSKAVGFLWGFLMANPREWDLGSPSVSAENEQKSPRV